MKRRRLLSASLASASSIAFVAVVSATGCRVGSGTGSVTGDLFVKDCWSGGYNLEPDFFAATPNVTDDSLIIRIQRGSDYVNFSDGIGLLVSHVSGIRGGNACTTDQDCLAPETCGAGTTCEGGSCCSSLLSTPLTIALPPAVVPPGVPVSPTQSPANVQFAVFLQATCRPETPGLYGMGLVTTNGGGDGGVLCGADTAALAQQCGPVTTPPPSGSSTITFQSLFDASEAGYGDPGSLSAEQRLIEATFDILLGDPRDECSGGIGPPPPCRGHLTGSFRFYFERGKPAQAFP